MNFALWLFLYISNSTALQDLRFPFGAGDELWVCYRMRSIAVCACARVRAEMVNESLYYTIAMLENDALAVH